MRHKNIITDRLENAITLTDTMITSIQNADRTVDQVLRIAKNVKAQLEFISERLELESQD